MMPILPARLYVAVFLVLIAMTLATVTVAFVDLGPLNTLVALTIAIAKATLVVLYFMHVRWSARLTWVFVGAGVAWLLILFSLTMSDYLSRGWLGTTPPYPGL